LERSSEECILIRDILITGVSRGVGYWLANKQIFSGSRVYGLSRNQPENFAQKDLFFFRQIDLEAVGNDENVENLMIAVRKLIQTADKLDQVVLNAGVLGEIQDLRDTALPELNRIMNINLWANKVLLDALLSSGVRVKQVVAISSGASVNGNRGWGGYSLSKAALNMLIKLYAAEWPDRETHFTALAPGIIDTGMQEQIADQAEDSRFPSLDRLRSKRGTEEMPTPEAAAPRLWKVIDALPELVESGEIADVRQSPLAEIYWGD
jgi:benzil reductase ((S)-benzoin forming)